MIIYNNKGNPYGLKIKICLNAAGSKIKYEELSAEGMSKIFNYKKTKKNNKKLLLCTKILCVNTELIKICYS